MATRGPNPRTTAPDLPPPVAGGIGIDVGDGNRARPAQGGDNGDGHRNPRETFRPPPRPVRRSPSVVTGGRGGDNGRRQEREDEGESSDG